MATTITLVSLNDPHIDNLVARSVDFFVYDGTNLWLGSQDGIDSSFTIAQVQMLLDSEASTLLTLVQNDVPYATGTKALALQYAAAHLFYRQTFAQAWFTLEDGIRTADGTLAGYRILLQNALNVINTLPQPFLTHLSNERTAQSLTMVTSVMTLAQCVSFDNLLHIWISSRLNGAVVASNLRWWTQ